MNRKSGKRPGWLSSSSTAEGGTRTHTPLQEADFKSAASTVPPPRHLLHCRRHRTPSQRQHAALSAPFSPFPVPQLRRFSVARPLPPPCTPMESGHYTNRHCESRCNRDVAIPYLNDEIASALSRLARTGVETCRATSGGSQFQWKEAAGGFEPPHRGFADPRLNLLATPPSRSGLLERKTGFEPATPSLARKYSTTELLPLLIDSTVFLRIEQIKFGAEGET